MLADYLLNQFLIAGEVFAVDPQYELEFLSLYLAIVVKVKSIENEPQVILIVNHRLVYAYCYEFVVIYLTVVVGVDRLQKFGEVAQGYGLALRFKKEFMELFDGNVAVLVKVNWFEDVSYLFDLILGHLGGDVGCYHFF